MFTESNDVDLFGAEDSATETEQTETSKQNEMPAQTHTTELNNDFMSTVEQYMIDNLEASVQQFTGSI
jgi:hypothetical protein